jgi:hypothetical protein
VRLIDDVVHEYEKLRSNRVGGNNQEPQWPGIYSLQFDLLKRTPEVFAARGIVALRPPLVLALPGQEANRFRFAQGLIDLLHNADLDVHANLSFDSALREIAGYVDERFREVLTKLNERFGKKALEVLGEGDEMAAEALATEVLNFAPDFGNQGAYLVGADGTIAGLAVPSGLDKAWRLKKAGRDFGSRPFFRQANSLREAFVSDSFPSQFNGNSTIALCLPLLEEEQFSGLLFLAHQFSDSDSFVKKICGMSAKCNGTLLIVDSNGVLLFPPEDEFVARVPSKDPAIPEEPSANVGFERDRLLYLSRRDKRVERIAHNVVPLAQDDDVYAVALDATVYTVLTELRFARWKVALTRFFPSKFQVDGEVDK